jgi:tetratricopeptide (TPR) repeat protein
VKIGAKERTIEIARQAIQSATVEGDRNMYAQARALSAMSQIMADLSEIEQAFELVQRATAAAKAIRLYYGELGGEVDKDDALAVSAQALVRTGRVDEALTIAERIRYKLAQVCILRDAAGELTRTGNQSRARSVAERARTVALKHETKLVKAYLLCAAAQALVATGDGAGARMLLQQVRDMEPFIENIANKALVWSLVGKVYLQSGDKRKAAAAIEAARDAAHGSAKLWDRIWALLALSGVMADMEMDGEATDVVEQAVALLNETATASGSQSSSNFRLYQFARFSRTFARIISGIAWPSELAVMLAATRLLVDAAHHQRAIVIAERALALANAISTDSQKTIALGLVSGAMAAVGQQETAQKSLLEALRLSHRLGRRQVFEALWHGADAIAAIDQGRCLPEMARAVLEIVDRWPPEARTLEEATETGGLRKARVTVAGQESFD